MGVPATQFESVSLCTVELVKTLVPVASGETSLDSALAALIPGVSARMTNAMRRHTKAGTRTETYQLSPSRSRLTLRGSPITNVATIKLSSTTDFASSTALVPGTDFHFNGLTGEVYFLATLKYEAVGPLGRAKFPAFIEVTWTGGYGTDATAIELVYPSIAQACAQQVAYLYQRTQKSAIGATKVQVGEFSSVAYETAYDWLPAVRAVIEEHTRRTL